MSNLYFMYYFMNLRQALAGMRIAQYPIMQRLREWLHQWNLPLLNAETVGAEDQTALERYALIRARIVSGKLNEAESHLSTDHNLEQSITALLIAQLNTYRGKAHLVDLKSLSGLCLKSHLSLEDQGFAHNYLEAERAFTIGYVHALRCQYTDSIRFYSAATKFYQNAGLPRQEGIAQFNLHVNYTHISNTQGRTGCLERLRTIISETHDPALTGLLRRAEAYDLLHSDHLTEADRCFSEAMRAFETIARWQDARVMRSYLIYIRLIRLDLESCDQLIEASLPGNAECDYLSERIRAFAEIRKHPLLSAKIAIELLSNYERAQMDGNTLLMITSILMSSLMRAKDYLGAIDLYEKHRTLSTKFEQSLDLIDLRLAAAEAYLASGDRLNGIKLLNLYETDAESTLASSRLERLKEIRLRHRVLDTRSLLRNSEARVPLVLDLAHKKLTIGKTTQDLSSIALPYRLLKTLATHPHGISYEEAFEKCYNCKFDILLHESKFNSVIARVKKLFEDKSAIHWVDSWIQISPNFEIIIIGKDAQEERCAS